MRALFKRSCKPLNSSWRGKRAEDQYGLSCLRDVLQKSALECDLIIDHDTAETSVLLGQNTVSDARIAFEAFVVHFLQHGCVYVYVIVCGDCGAFYGSKVWHSTDEYRRTIWRCNNKYAGETKCTTPHVTQEPLEKAFVQVMRQVLSQKDAILTACREALDEAFDTTKLDKAATRLHDQAPGMAERVRQLVEENARVQRNQEEFKEDYEVLLAEHTKLSEKIRAIAVQKKGQTFPPRQSRTMQMKAKRSLSFSCIPQA